MAIHSLVYFLSLILLTSFLYPCLSELCNPDDKRVLLQIKQAFNNPYHLASWDPKSDCCEWSGVKCTEDTGRVYGLFINNADFGGQIPPQVADLTQLESLSYNNCPYIRGPIPPSIAKLKYLSFLMIAKCNLSGPVPDFLGQMKTLDSILLHFNRLTGPIPTSIGNLPKLTGLRLDRNDLTGPIPDTFGNLRGDFYLYLSHNRLSGKIPASLAAATTLAYVDLSRNRLEGDATPLFGRDKKNLWNLDLSRNLLSFDFSKVQLPKNLRYLDLNHNKIFGSLPLDLTKVNSFNVSYNQLCGKIPAGLKVQDVTAYFHNRCLCGAPLPKCK